MTRRAFALYLAMTPGFGGRTVVRILTRCELQGISTDAFFALSDEALKEEFGLNVRQVGSLRKVSAPEAYLKPIQERLDTLGVSWVTLADANYPTRIEEFDPDPPGVLFLYGNQKLLEQRTFTVLSSRDSSSAALDRIERRVEDGVLAGEVLVTGHDTPEYQQAAIVPLRWGAPRIIGLDRGMFPVLGDQLKDEPFRAARLWRFQFDPRTDLVVSPFRPMAEFKGVNNQVRDRLIASLSLRLEFIQITPDGNMDKLAKLGIKAGRDVRISDLTLGYRRFWEAGARPLEG